LGLGDSFISTSISSFYSMEDMTNLLPFSDQSAASVSSISKNIGEK
jgi:hypothetical protein